MSHFTNYQIRRFRFIFNQYSEGVGISATVESPDNIGSSVEDPFLFASNNSSIAVNDSSGWIIRVNYKLTANELIQLMPRFGPPITLTQARDFIYEYDSSCTGCLDFDDFIEFLGDYQAILQVRRDKALGHYYGKLNLAQTPDQPGDDIWTPNDYPAHDDPKILIARLFIQKFQEPTDYLATLSLDDPEFFFTKTESVTTEIIEKGFIDDMSILKRSIVVRIYSARNLSAFTRIKKRIKKGIEFTSLDPMIRIELAGIVRQTSAIVATTKPDWDQDLKFEITIPPGEIHDVQQWVDRQVMSISLMDFDGSGSAHNSEVIGVTTIPLLKILLSVKKPMWQVVKLNQMDSCLALSRLPVLELSISDNTREQWAWAKIVDAYAVPEEVWYKKHQSKVLADLNKLSRMPNIDPSSSSSSYMDFDLWGNYRDMIRPLRTSFRRRCFHTFTLNEHNQVVPLTTLVTPITIPDSNTAISTPQDAAKHVARIAYRTAIVARSKMTNLLISKCLSDAQEEALARADRIMENQSAAGWRAQYGWCLSATQNLFAQVSSPQTVLLQKQGTLMELSMLLCGLLLGLGIPSYVAIGHVKRRPYVWVVSILQSESASAVVDEMDDFAACQIVYTNVVGNPLAYNRTDFRQMAEAAKRQNGNKEVQIVHWDAATGTNYTKSSQANFPFDKIETLFDNTNIFYNIQKSDNLKRTFFSWDLANLNHWVPFFPEDLTPESPIRCFYTPTDSIFPPPSHKVSSEADSRMFLIDLAQNIQLYRKNALFIPKTVFHRPASKFLQAHLNRFELRLSEIMSENMNWNGGRADSTPFRSSLYQRGTYFNSSQTFLVDVSSLSSARKSSVEAGLVRKMHQDLAAFTPDRSWYRGTIMHFKSSNVDDIMEHLVSLGLLNATLPGISFVIGARIFTHQFANSVWVGIGYFQDLCANEVHHLLNPVNYDEISKK
ncbi:hypothetical protein BCR33DRAFT_847478 [Rhizoclosmatium globosum]|uniref:C2 domain-containing protein n=1 Tax=Rhizoclosmatium globosum TaxID=329046 RepID=A0A1Y2CRB9_9FUNG|nr:hypothetical protein BCR33DRAFT_847478 [Rhizoclosmatium globosum]|eukprot:ORY49523.1 hypothetical protein BCR33DRAFT_847478 [Rhizoclosmatium globosum]